MPAKVPMCEKGGKGNEAIAGEACIAMANALKQLFWQNVFGASIQS